MLFASSDHADAARHPKLRISIVEKPAVAVYKEPGVIATEPKTPTQTNSVTQGMLPNYKQT